MKSTHPRASLNLSRFGGSPEKSPRKTAEPEREPEPATTPEAEQKPPDGPKAKRARKPRSDHRRPAATKLEPEEMAKLDRIRKGISPAEMTVSATLRWLVQDFDETRLR